MSESFNQKPIQTDWSIKDLNEIDRRNLLGFFGLLLKVDRRIAQERKKQNANNRGSDTTDKAE